MTDPIQPPQYVPTPPYAPGPQYAPGQQYAPGPNGATPYGTSGWGAPEPVTRSRGLGLTAMLIAASVFVLSIVASVVVGMSAGPLASRTSSSFNFSTSHLSPEQAASFAPVGILMGVQILLGTVLGILALVLGIIAVATRRGRPFGIVGICLAVAAPIVSFGVYMAALAVTLPPA